MESSYTPTYSSKSLLDALEFVRPERKALIENFLYEKTSMLWYAPDGIGKSVISLQAAMQSTVKDTKVFGEFHVPEACKVLYMQLERPPEETFERMKHMRKGIPFDADNFGLSVALQGINLQNRDGDKEALDIMRTVIGEIKFKPQIIVFDPIYTLCHEGLESVKACNAITNFFRVMQLQQGCAIIAISHANRGMRDQETGGRKGEDMYGNRFLSAHFGGVYKIESIKEGAGTRFKLEKSSLKNLDKTFDLFYEPQYYRSMILDDGKVTKKDRLQNFLQTQRSMDKPFSFEDMKTISLLSDSALRGYLSGELKEKLTVVDKLNKGKVLYKFSG